jgi:hypothetical protein
MTAEDKKPWEEKAAADKERHAQEMKEYKASGGGGGASSSKGKDKMSVDDFEKVACLSVSVLSAGCVGVVQEGAAPPRACLLEERAGALLS